MVETPTSILMFPSLLCQIFNVCVRNPPPYFAENIMQNVTAIKGDDVEFRCKVNDVGRHMVAFLRAEVPPRLIAFDERVFRQRDKYEIKSRVNENEWILKVKDVQESDIGGYVCQLNSNPVISRVAYLHLKIPPSVSRSSTPSAVEVREGHNVTLSCKATGNPEPSVVWRRQDRQIIRFNGATGYGASVYNGSDLHLTKVSRKHMSEYVCVASNGIPPDESWTVKLHITFEPIVIPQATVVEARRGSLVRLVCNVEAWPRAHVTWLLNDLELFDSNKYSTEQAVAEKYKSVHVLEIKEVGREQFGVYRCIASNDYGKHFADIRLIESPQHTSIGVLLTEGSGSSSEIDTESGDDEVDEYQQVVRSLDLEQSTLPANNRRRSNDVTSNDTPLNIIEDYSTSNAPRHFGTLLLTELRLGTYSGSTRILLSSHVAILILYVVFRNWS